MRKCVYEELSKDELHKLFLELRRLLKLLLQKFQRQYPKEVMKDQCSKIMRWSMAEQEVEPSQPAALST
uniref:Uncharacterized protein n=1 Tax=Kalanchoe fedtschenkoi TaxID=63787 RepID=A0A7N0URY8_KALFE